MSTDINLEKFKLKTVLFIHRSVGYNLIHDGKVYDLVAKNARQFNLSDYDQNTDLLTDNSGQKHKKGFVFPGGNTRPMDLAAIFTEQVSSDSKAIQDFALSYDVIILKSCYPNSNIKSDKELESIKKNYLSIAEYFSARPEKQLVIMTSPPLAPIMTKSSSAQRARQLADWLSGTNLDSNISVFNFFDLLAAPEGQRNANRLRKEYRRRLPFDSHPSTKASKVIAPMFVAFLEELT